MTVPDPSPTAMSEARARQKTLTKPPGSLGALEQLPVVLAGAQGVATPTARPAAALLFAADHPVVRHGVSAYPAEVTAAMVRNFVTGGAAASVLARAQGVPLAVVDVGVAVAEPLQSSSDVQFVRDPVADLPAGDLRVEDAMSDDVMARAWDAGVRAVQTYAADARVVVLGEMGIGNTTAAACVVGALLRLPGGEVVGRGTGVDDDALACKIAVVDDALARLGGERDAWQVIRRVGGRELAALAGAAAEAIARGAVVLVDGFIVSAAMLALVRIEPRVRPFLLFGHRSGERAHGRVLAALDASPLLDLGLRLGEASGALAALPLVDLACRLHAEMATFASAAVPDRDR